MNARESSYLRMIYDAPNSNNRLYRESESYVKINQDRDFLRKEFQDRKEVYELAQDPSFKCTTHSASNYNAE